MATITIDRSKQNQAGKELVSPEAYFSKIWERTDDYMTAATEMLVKFNIQFKVK